MAVSGQASRFPALAGPLAEPLEPASAISAKKSATRRRFSGAGRSARRSAGRHCRLPIGERSASSIFFSKHYIYAICTSFSFAPLVLTSFLSILISVQEQQREMSNAGGSSGGSGGDAEEYERQMNEELEAYTSREINRLIQRALQPAVPRPPPVVHRRAVIDRDHVAAHQRLYEDYFAEEPRFGAPLFRRRFRMRRAVFMRIVDALERRYLCFRFRYDAAGRPGHTPIQKCTAAIRQLAYGGAADMWDEYLHIGETTALDCLKYFCQGVIEIFRDQYLRSPTPEECQDLMQMHGEKHGFPGMLGSIDCMHWEWKNCPAAWKGFYTTGYKGKNPTMILEAVADYRLWIWHAYFGVAGSNNDLNVLNSSPLFNEQCQGVGPAISFIANGNQHDMGYYLADGIYPRWPVFVKTIRCASDERKTYFAERQESARKDVERAFGVLQSRWAAIRGPTRLWHVDCIADIMYACIILHNMIVEDEGVQLTSWANDDANEAGPSHGVAAPNVRRGVPHDEVGRLKAHADMRQVDAHIRLQKDLIEELWARRTARR